MRVSLFGALAMAGTGAAAQAPTSSPPPPALTSIGGVTYGVVVASYGAFPGARGSTETPTLRRQKLQRALALREEALALQARDGGTLSEAHVRYINRKARCIVVARAPG